MQRSTPLALAILIGSPLLAAPANDATRANPLGPTVAAPAEHESATPTRHETPTTLAFGPAIPVFFDAPVSESQDITPEETPVAFPPVDPQINDATADEPDPVAIEAAVQAEPQPAAGATSSESIPLGRSRLAPITESGGGDATDESMSDNWLLRTVAALVVVIGMILGVRFALQWIETKTGGGSAFSSNAKAPSGLVEVLARYTVSRGTKLLLLKIDSRILVVSQTSGEMHTLSEITDPDEVASILIKSRDDEGESIAGQFTRILRGLETDPSVMDDPISPQSPRRALVSAQADDDYADEADHASPRDGASILRDRLSRFGDLSA